MLFLLKETTMSTWYDVVSILYPIEVCSIDVEYAIISMNHSKKYIMGFVVFHSKGESNIMKLRDLFYMYDIYICQETVCFEHLTISCEMFRLIVLNNANMLWEEGSLINDQVKPILPLSPIISDTDILNFFEDSKRTTNVLIIEESYKANHIRYGVARLVKETGILSFCMKGYIDKVHIIHSSGSQCYHSFRFHKNPHYGLKLKHLCLLKWILTTTNTPFIEYEACERYHHNEFLTIHNNLIGTQFPLKEIYSLLKGRQLRTRNLSNYFISYGYSAMFRNLSSGEPLLTKAIELVTGKKKKILPLVLPIICNISRDLKANYPNIAPDNIRNTTYAQRMGSNFHYSLEGINYFEGFDVAIMYEGDVIDPHCDVMNDWREGYDYLSVVKSKFLDDELDKYVTVSIICYSRKAIGDFMYGSGVNTIL